jgi:hypothetical protein
MFIDFVTFCYATAMGTVGLAALLGLVAVWFEDLLPSKFVGRALATLGIVFASAVVGAILTGVRSYF